MGSLQDHAAWVVPLLLVGLQFLLKLFIGERAGILATWKQFLQNPVDIGFLALSFTASIIISNKDRAATTFVIALIYVLLLIVSIIIWKYSPKNIVGARNAACFLIINYIITIPMLVYSISLLEGP